MIIGRLNAANDSMLEGASYKGKFLYRATSSLIFENWNDGLICLSDKTLTANNNKNAAVTP